MRFTSCAGGQMQVFHATKMDVLYVVFATMDQFTTTTAIIDMQHDQMAKEIKYDLLLSKNLKAGTYAAI